MKKYLNPNIPKPTPGANEGDGTVKIPRQPRPTTPSPRKRPAPPAPRPQSRKTRPGDTLAEYMESKRRYDYTGNSGKTQKTVPGGRVIGPVKKKPIKARGAR